MGQAVEITCPDCKKIFVVNPHMLGSGMNFHCPFCDLYFPEKDSPKSASNLGLATVTISPWPFFQLTP